MGKSDKEIIDVEEIKEPSSAAEAIVAMRTELENNLTDEKWIVDNIVNPYLQFKAEDGKHLIEAIDVYRREYDMKYFKDLAQKEEEVITIVSHILIVHYNQILEVNNLLAFENGLIINKMKSLGVDTTSLIIRQRYDIRGELPVEKFNNVIHANRYVRDSLEVIKLI